MLLLYSSVDGQTLKIANFLVDEFNKKGQEVSLFEIDAFQDGLENFDKIPTITKDPYTYD